jgi:hypothetical protein
MDVAAKANDIGKAKIGQIREQLVVAEPGVEWLRPPDGSNGLDARKHHPPRNPIRRTGRLDTPSMPESGSAFPAGPPQPSWRILSRMSRLNMARCAECTSLTLLATPFAGDAHEPTRERSERLVHSLGAGREGIVAIAAPVPCGGGLAGHATPALFGSESGQVRGSAAEILKQPAARQRIW